MKILVITSRYYPEQFSIVKICEKFVEMGHSITVITGKPNYGYWKVLEGYESVSSEDINGVRVNRVNETPRKKGLFGLIKNYFSIFREYKKKLKHHKEHYDVVLSHVMSPIFTMSGIARFCKKIGIPHVHYGLDLWPESLIASSYFKRCNPVFQLTKLYSKKLYSKCDYITFASPSVEGYFRNYLGIKKVPFKHIYQPTLTTKMSNDIVQNHLYMSNDVLHILYCGSIARFHRLDILLDAAYEYKRMHLDTTITIDIVGSGSELDKLIFKSKQLELDDMITFHGRVTADQTKEFYLNADILYVPLENNSATSKMIPQKLIEYLMYNRPILGMIVGDGEALLKQASEHNVICDQSIKGVLDGIIKIGNNYRSFNLCGNQNRSFYDLNNRFLLSTICQEIIDVCTSAINMY